MMSTAFHPQTDCQSERTIQVLEHMLRACVLDFKGSWEEHFPLVNSPITTVIRQAYRWHLMRPYMGGHVDLRFVGRRWERAPPRVLTGFETPPRKWV